MHLPHLFEFNGMNIDFFFYGLICLILLYFVFRVVKKLYINAVYREFDKFLKSEGFLSFNNFVASTSDRLRVSKLIYDKLDEELEQSEIFAFVTSHTFVSQLQDIRCKALSNFDKFDIYEYTKKILIKQFHTVNGNDNFFNIQAYIRDLALKYLSKYNNRLPDYKDFDWWCSRTEIKAFNSQKHLLFSRYHEIECDICERYDYTSIYDDISIKCKWSYTSPAGRNHYESHKNMTYHDLCNILRECKVVYTFEQSNDKSSSKIIIPLNHVSDKSTQKKSNSAVETLKIKYEADNKAYEERNRTHIELKRKDYDKENDVSKPKRQYKRNSDPAHTRNIRASQRQRILRRDNFTCQLCGARGPAVGGSAILHVDHIKPFSKGGLTVDDNLWTLCSDCNLGKSNNYDDTTLAKYGTTCKKRLV